MRKRLISVAVALCLVVSLATTAAFAASFTDTEGHWAEEAITRWSEYDVVNGTSETTFSPDNSMTRAQAAQVFVNLLKLTGSADLSAYTDVSADAWYADALSTCVANGILNGMGDGTMNPNGTITREQFFVMFARALGIPEETSLDQNFADAGSFSTWARGSVYALINRGYVSGVSATSGAPLANINRASVRSLLDQAIVAYVTESGAVTVNEDGVVLVLADNATLSGSGDVLVAVAKADANVNVSGMTGSVEVVALENNVAVSGAPAGTTVMAAEGVTGTTVNGISVPADGQVTVSTPSGGSSGGGNSGGTTVLVRPDIIINGAHYKWDADEQEYVYDGEQYDYDEMESIMNGALGDEEEVVIVTDDGEYVYIEDQDEWFQIFEDGTEEAVTDDVITGILGGEQVSEPVT